MTNRTITLAFIALALGAANFVSYGFAAKVRLVPAADGMKGGGCPLTRPTDPAETLATDVRKNLLGKKTGTADSMVTNTIIFPVAACGVCYFQNSLSENWCKPTGQCSDNYPWHSNDEFDRIKERYQCTGGSVRVHCWDWYPSGCCGSSDSYEPVCAGTNEVPCN
ncbi:hypothetical protein BH11ARM2_BH11ARM2_26060 [soil metagenome]